MEITNVLNNKNYINTDIFHILFLFLIVIQVWQKRAYISKNNY